MKRKLGALLCVALFTSCSSNNALDDFSSAKERVSIESSNESQQLAMNELSIKLDSLNKVYSTAPQARGHLGGLVKDHFQ